MTEGAWDETLGEKQHPPVVSAQTHTLTHTLSKDEGAVIPKEKVRKCALWCHNIKNFFLGEEEMLRANQRVISCVTIDSFEKSPTLLCHNT